MRRALLSAAIFFFALQAPAQTSLGSVKTQGNEVSGLVTVSNGTAVIGNAASVAAGIQPAEVALKRGGTLVVCTGSAAHLSQSSMSVARPPMLLALDRGTMEVRMNAEKTDGILTPDLRFELSGAAPLDLRIRVVPNGDTCVDNAGKDAPMLHVTETFGDATYFIRPGQRVLFEHGSLREVVDHESSSCGCPKPDALVLAGKGRLGDGKVPDHPFPEAVSQGLQQPEAPQSAPVGETHTRVNSTLRYDGTTNTASGPPGQSTSGDSLAAAVQPPAPSAQDIHMAESRPPEKGPNPFRAIGHFFRKLFGVHD